MMLQATGTHPRLRNQSHWMLLVSLEDRQIDRYIIYINPIITFITHLWVILKMYYYKHQQLLYKLLYIICLIYLIYNFYIIETGFISSNVRVSELGSASLASQRADWLKAQHPFWLADELNIPASLRADWPRSSTTLASLRADWLMAQHLSHLCRTVLQLWRAPLRAPLYLPRANNNFIRVLSHYLIY